MDYAQFVAHKLRLASSVGFQPEAMHPRHFPHQVDLVRWACRKGRAAIFADTGLGKTGMQLEWARQVAQHTQRPVLILAPLAVTSQTAAEGSAMGIEVFVSRDGRVESHISTINYDRLHLVSDVSSLGGVVLDESSIIKAYDGALRSEIIRTFADTPYKLACTATPAPNDWTELGNHAEFLGVCSRAEMLATYFCHDGGETSVWRLKGHAKKDFWRWVASWGAVVRRPSDLGHEDAGYALPPLRWHEHKIQVSQEMAVEAGMLFLTNVTQLSEQRGIRRATMEDRVGGVAELVNASDEPWIVWCELNDESDALAKAIPDAVVVEGSDSAEDKAERMLGFAAGKYRVLISKPKIAGFGMNFQRCSKMAFVGASHSYESTYQAVRRCWRFGQTKPVDVHVFVSTADGAIVSNYRQKEADAITMQSEMVAAMRSSMEQEIHGSRRDTIAYGGKERLIVPPWLVSEP